ncbi:MAG: hypothetical protein K6C97_02015, partial [Treponema sp.]|nr:hypothetical protein [Treponema sp.]
MLDWNTYPRPSLKREGNYEILNDGWSLNGLPIQLPFPPESQLSGYKGDLGPELTYQREILLPDQAQACLKDGGCLMLYFGAVDQVCDLFVNDQLV